MEADEAGAAAGGWQRGGEGEFAPTDNPFETRTPAGRKGPGGWTEGSSEAGGARTRHQIDMDAIEHALRERGFFKEVNRTFNLIAIPLLIIAVIGVGFILVWAQEILVPFVIALFFTYLLKPMVNALSQPLGSCSEANCLNFFNPAACRRRSAAAAFTPGIALRKDSSGEIRASFDHISVDTYSADEGLSKSSTGSAAACESKNEVELSSLIDHGDQTSEREIRSRASISGGPLRDSASRPARSSSMMGNPSLCFRCRRWRLPRWISILLSMLLVFGFFAGVAILIADAVQTFEDEDIEMFEDQMVELGLKLKDWVKRVFGVELKSMIEQFRTEFHWVSLTKGLVLTVLGGLEYAFVIFLFVLYMLFEDDSDLLTAHDVGLSSSHSRARDLRRQIDIQIQRYIVIKTLISLVVGFLVYLVLGPMLGVKMAHIFGVITFFANYVPNVGAIAATLVPIPLVVLDPGQTNISAVLAVALPVLIHSIVGNVVEPKVFGDSMELHPVVVLLSVSAGFALWGMAGAVLSVPLVAVIRITLSHVKHPYANVVLYLLEGKLPGSRAFHAL